MNRLTRLPLLAAHEVLKGVLCIWDSITQPVYMNGWCDGHAAGVAHALAEKERSK